MLVLAERNRAFGYAAAASVALHALVLLMHGPALRQGVAPPPEPALIAHLVEAPATVVEEEPAPPPPAVKRPPRHVAKPKLRPVPPPVSLPTPIPAPAPATAEESPEIAEGVDHAPAELAMVAPPPAVAPAAPAPAAQPPDPAAELARFRQQLVDLAVRYKRYPRIALDNGWTGDVVVRIEVTANGAVSAVKLKSGSGYEVLDAQALEMFRKAAPEVAVPPALRGRNFAVEVRAIYNLQDRPG